MAYELATEDEIKLAQKRRDPFPWAAGEPGTFFDKPGDILWCCGGGDTDTYKVWARVNNIPGFQSYPDGNYIKVQGWNILTFQKGAQIRLDKENEDMTEFYRVLDLLIPEKLPVVVQLEGQRMGERVWIKGLFFDLFEPGLSEHASFNIFFSGDTWMLTRSRWGSVSLVFENTDREAFFEKAREEFGWIEDRFEEMEDEDDN